VNRVLTRAQAPRGRGQILTSRQISIFTQPLCAFSQMAVCGQRLGRVHTRFPSSNERQ
jgi:hypothetical protein